MKNFHVISTGTSILANFSTEASKNEKYKKVFENYEMRDWSKLSPDDPKQEKINNYISRGNEVHETLYGFVKKDPKAASAELNSFLSFIDQQKQTKESIEIALYCTDTANNRLCAQLVMNIYKKKALE